MAGGITAPQHQSRWNIILVWSALLLASAFTWALTLRDARMMGNMPGTMGMPIFPFIIMWTVMMAAMMLPSLAPVALVYLNSILKQSTGVVQSLRVSGFVLAYLAVWSAFGIFSYGVAWLIDQLIRESREVMVWLYAAVLIMSGAYQFSSLKINCLRLCRSPVGFIFHFGKYRGPFKDIQVGLYHGFFCAGCCLGLMVVMMMAGVMNILWMVALAMCIFIEKIWRYGREFSYGTGILLMGVGCLLPWYPFLLR